MLLPLPLFLLWPLLLLFLPLPLFLLWPLLLFLPLPLLFFLSFPKGICCYLIRAQHEPLTC